MRDDIRSNARAGARGGFTLIELLIVVVIIGILASIAIPKFGSTKERAYLAKMKGDLRNFATAQESYLGDNQVYYGGAVPNPLLTFNPSSGVTIVVASATAGGWSATASYVGTPKTCAMYYGSAPPLAPAIAEGVIGCTP